VLALPVGAAIRAQLFHVRPSDPLVLASAAIAVLVAAVVASAIPARRATRVDPVTALRND
jgi:ABC-type antimicrobial peptide transport system permease subunit